MKISEYLSISLKRVKKIRKELDESNRNYEGMAALKSHSDHSDWKRTTESLSEIQPWLTTILTSQSGL